MSTYTDNPAKLPLLIAVSFLIALLLNIVLNCFCLSLSGRRQLAGFHPDRMTSSSDKLIYLDKKNEWPILFLGSSQVHWGVNPESFQNLNAFNLGMKGTYFRSQDFVLELLLKQGKKIPLIILECSPILTNKHQNEFVIKKELMPYLIVKNPQILLSQIKEESSNVIKVFQIMQTRDWIDWLSGSQVAKKTFYNRFGFEGKKLLSIKEQEKQDTFTNLNPSYIAHYQFDEASMVSMIHRLKKAHIPMVIVQYPMTPVLKAKLKQAGVLSSFEKSVETLSKAHHIPYWDLSSIQALDMQYKAYFIDGNHLNKDGARILTELLEKKLKYYAF